MMKRPKPEEVGRFAYDDLVDGKPVPPPPEIRKMWEGFAEWARSRGLLKPLPGEPGSQLVLPGFEPQP